MKQLNDLRVQAHRLKDSLGQKRITGTALDGRVEIVMNGNHEVLSTTIDQGLLTPESKTKLEEALSEATNHALQEIQQVIAQTMREFGGFPGL